MNFNHFDISRERNSTPLPIVTVARQFHLSRNFAERLNGCEWLRQCQTHNTMWRIWYSLFILKFRSFLYALQFIYNKDDRSVTQSSNHNMAFDAPIATHTYLSTWITILIVIIICIGFQAPSNDNPSINFTFHQADRFCMPGPPQRADLNPLF